LTLSKKVKDLTYTNNNTMFGGSNIIEFMKVLNELSIIMKNKGEVFRSLAYTKAINELKKYMSSENASPINSAHELKSLNLPNIGKTILEKYEEFLKTGTLEAIEKERANPINIFANIYGIGHVKANELVNSKNIKTLDELKEKQNELQENKLPLLNKKQQIGLKYYNDLLKRIPRTEINEFKSLFKSKFRETIIENGELEENHKFEIAGSYRRKAENSGDIDLICTSYNNNKTVFVKFIEKLFSKNILIEALSSGETKSLTIGKLLKEGSIPRRLDFLYAPQEDYAFTLLYFTGSKDFNTATRQHALNLDLTLSEHGFYKVIHTTKAKQEKILNLLFKTEKDIFDFLCMEYKEPQDRIDEHSVILTLPIEEIKKHIEEKIKVKQEAPAPKAPEEKQEVKPAPAPAQEPAPAPAPEEKQEVKPTPASAKKDTLKIKMPNSKAQTLKKYTKKIKEAILENLNKFKSQGITALAILSLEELTAMLQEAIDNYYISELKESSLLTDNEYDILREYILKKDPTNALANDQQTQIKNDNTKVKLPYEMWSMDKIKPDTNALTKFKQTYKGPYVISAKVDGVSALYSTETGIPNLYKKGDGKFGFLINHLLPYLNLPKENNITLRGELMIKEETFKLKYKGQFSNSRNFIAGIVNRKKLTRVEKDILQDIDFVGYEVIMPQNLKPSEQYNKLTELNVISVKNIQALNYEQLTNDYLSNKLIEFRTTYTYSIDGIICIDDNLHDRKSKNPEHAFAFKMVLTDQVIEAKVLDVLWSVSKDGLLKPRVQFEPVTIGGVTITYATGINARFIVDNNIGLGALVSLTRSGDVIPKITSVIVPAQKPIMPSTDEYDYVWNATNVDIILKNIKSDPRVNVKSIAKFFKDLEVEGLGEKNIEKIINSGANSIIKIINLSTEDLMKVEGFQKKMATKIKTSIQKQLDEASIAKIAAASNIFGRGLAERTINAILKAEPNILTSGATNEEKISKVNAVEGVGEKTALQFVKAIPEFVEFITLIKPDYQTQQATQPTEQAIQPTQAKEADHALKNKIIVFSDFDKSSKYTKKELEKKLVEFGPIIETSVKKTTNILIIGDSLSNSTKVENAKKIGTIEIITLDDFLEKYVDVKDKTDDKEVDKTDVKTDVKKTVNKKINIYILSLAEEKYYVGTTTNKNFTLQSYLNNNNASWTQKYKPLKVIRFIEDSYDYEEDIVTINLMKLYGIANVRGGSYSNVNLDKSTLDTIKQKIK
jgi:NAD-dependent DNA ligase/predicted GIY-YIG superfamily endonuclease